MLLIRVHELLARNLHLPYSIVNWAKELLILKDKSL